ncbi:MAG: DUF2946 family protein [Pseudomonadota bacterium]
MPLLPFVLTSLLPFGLMPAPSGHGLVTLVICTADGAVMLAVPADQAPPPSEDGRSHDVPAPCPFSLHAAPAVLPPAIKVSEAVTYRLSPPAITPELPGRIDPIVNPRPRGPPVPL